jgi:hypothetical protein
MRDQIWAGLVDLKFKGYCLALLVDKFQRWDRSINIYLAIASSGSIAAWAIWNNYPAVWGAIIALSQVLTVIKPYFPYFKYVKELNAKCSRVDVFNIEFEKLWYKMQNKKITEDMAVENYFELRKSITETLNFGDDTVFKVTDKMEAKANEKMKIFFKSNYNVTININQ